MKVSNHGFVSAGRCPVTYENAINSVKDFKNFHLSYNPSIRDYGAVTTAIVLDNHVFLNLNGDHREAFVDFFIANIKSANAKSERYILIGRSKDLFNLLQAARKLMGQDKIARMSEADEC